MALSTDFIADATVGTRGRGVDAGFIGLAFVASTLGFVAVPNVAPRPEEGGDHEGLYSGRHASQNATSYGIESAVFSEAAAPGKLPNWVSDVYSNVAVGHTDAALDIVFRELDELFTNGRFELCSEIVRSIDLARLDTNLVVGILSAALPAKNQLPGWQSLAENAKTRLKQLAPNRVGALLIGLT